MIGLMSILGFGKEASWGKALQAKIDSYRDFILGLPPSASDDVAFLVDAYDVLFPNPSWIIALLHSKKIKVR